MATKKKAAPSPDSKKVININESDYDGKSHDQVIAEISQSPIAANATTAKAFAAGSFGEVGISDAMDAMREKVVKVQTGDMTDMESLLVAQATSLAAIYNEMARRAALNMGEYLSVTETYLRLAFKAQSQCRTTVEALAEIKTPRHVSFVRQANIAHGHQQVNNGVQGNLPAHGNNSIQSNELSRASNELLPDTRASQAESRVNPTVETVAELDGAANRGRQGQQRSQ